MNLFLKRTLAILVLLPLFYYAIWKMPTNWGRESIAVALSFLVIVSVKSLLSLFADLKIVPHCRWLSDDRVYRFCFERYGLLWGWIAAAITVVAEVALVGYIGYLLLQFVIPTDGGVFWQGILQATLVAFLSIKGIHISLLLSREKAKKTNDCLSSKETDGCSREL